MPYRNTPYGRVCPLDNLFLSLYSISLQKQQTYSSDIINTCQLSEFVIELKSSDRTLIIKYL